MNFISFLVTGQLALFYLHDIVMVSMFADEHTFHFENFWGLLNDAGYHWSTKCQVFNNCIFSFPKSLNLDARKANNIQFAGYIASSPCLKSQNYDPSLEYRTCLAYLFRNYTQIDSLLNQKLQTDQPCCYKEGSDRELGARYAVHSTRQAHLTNNSGNPRSQGTCSLGTEAGDGEIGIVLFQKQLDEKVKPIGHCSPSLGDAENSCNMNLLDFLIVDWIVLLLHSFF